MAKAKPKGKTKAFLSPFLLMIAAMAGWGATHVPAQFSDIGDVGGWGLSAIAVGLGVRAALAFMLPLLGIVTALGGRLLRDTRGRDEEAES